MTPGEQARATNPFAPTPPAAPTPAVATLTPNPFAPARAGTPLERLTAEIRDRGGKLPIRGESLYRVMGIANEDVDPTIRGFLANGQITEDLDDDGKPVALRLP